MGATGQIAQEPIRTPPLILLTPQPVAATPHGPDGEPRSRGFSEPFIGQPFYGWYPAR